MEVRLKHMPEENEILELVITKNKELSSDHTPKEIEEFWKQQFNS